MKRTKHLIALLTVVVMVFTFGFGLLTACKSNKYTITFDANGGKFGSETTTTVETDSNGVVASAPTAPTRDGYVFKGYNTSKTGKGDEVKFGAEGTVFEADATVYAQWEVKSPDGDDEVGYTITLDANGGAFSDGETTAQLKTNENGVITSWRTPTRGGYEFDGWNTSRDASIGLAVDEDYVFAEDTTIYAHWKEVQVPTEPVEITLDPVDGTLPEGVSETLMTSADGLITEELPEAIPNDGSKFFVGWFKEDGEQVEENKTVFMEDTTIYAHYMAGEVEITLVVGAGTLADGASETMTTVKGKLSNLPDVTPTGERATFLGWFTEVTGGELVDENTVFEEACSIYAQYWYEYLITLNYGSYGTWDADKPAQLVTVDHKLPQTLPSPTGTTNGWNFLDWFDSASGGNAIVEAETTFSSDATIYVQYGRANGLWVGTTFIAEVFVNSGNTDTSVIEYWLGDGKTVALTKNQVITWWVNNKQCTGVYIMGVGVSNIGSNVNQVTVQTAGDYKIFLKDYGTAKGSIDWVCEFRTSTPVNLGTKEDIPEGAGAIVITLGSFDPITIYLQTYTGAAVTEAQLGSYCIYTFEDPTFGTWDECKTQGKCAPTITAAATKIPNGWIFRWGSSYNTQTANIENAIEAGGTYVVKLPSGNNGAATITKIIFED